MHDWLVLIRLWPKSVFKLSPPMIKSPDSELVKVVARSCQLFDDAYNNNDPKALTELFTENATLVTDSGVLNGRDAILKYQIEIFNIIKFSNHKGGRPRLHSSARNGWKRILGCRKLEPDSSN